MAGHLHHEPGGQLRRSAAPGDRGWFGWYSNPRIEELTAAWLVAEGEAEQKRIAEAIQQESWQQVPFLPLGQFFIRTAHRGVTGMLKGTSPYPWNIRRA